MRGSTSDLDAPSPDRPAAPSLLSACLPAISFRPVRPAIREPGGAPRSRRNSPSRRPVAGGSPAGFRALGRAQAAARRRDKEMLAGKEGNARRVCADAASAQVTLGLRPRFSRDPSAPRSYVRVDFWGLEARQAAQHLHRGRQVAVGGHLRSERYVDRAGQTRTALKARGRPFQCCGVMLPAGVGLWWLCWCVCVGGGGNSNAAIAPALPRSPAALRGSRSRRGGMQPGLHVGQTPLKPVWVQFVLIAMQDRIIRFPV
jgi:Single-strand binding protein family